MATRNPPEVARLVEKGLTQVSEPKPYQHAALWRRGMMHTIERLDLVVPQTGNITGPRAKAILADVRRVLDEVTEFQRRHFPGSYEEAFDLCSQDLRAARAAKQGRAA